jgi:hypothetical protein
MGDPLEFTIDERYQFLQSLGIASTPRFQQVSDLVRPGHGSFPRCANPQPVNAN